MAWNEPGKGEDPWKNRNGRNQPPDIDEVVKNLQRQLKGIFGGGDGSGKGSGQGGSFGIGMLLVVALVVWVLAGLYKVDAAERGVVLRFGEYAKTTLPGLHWRPRGIDSVDIINVDNLRSRDYKQSMLTADENIVELSITIQYRVANPEEFLFNVRDPDLTLQEVSESAVREIVGQRQLDFVLGEGRDEITEQTRLLAQTTLDSYGTGIEVYIVNLLDAQPPDEVQAAFADAIKAREDEERFKLEAEAYSNDILPRARGLAKRRLEEAEAYRSELIETATGDASRFTQLMAEYLKAPGVTRQRLYLETMEEVYGDTNKVLIDAQGSGSLMYLPIDKLIQQQQRTPSSLNAPSSQSDSSLQRDNARRSSSRSRGDR